ncbi:copper transporter 5-like [Impatiens glandulifera]|uniref:copper transporter 5-like n=1 Tax=Impatiens glandulifera TaxID=253017 RepID=UPI001FB10A0E|nr:copper transporter 5-like [Impatiens glandulifera]
MMHMTFYWGTTVTLLFDFWKTDSLISYILTLLVCFLFSTFYQYLEDRRLRFKLQSLNSSKTVINSSPSPGASIDSPLLLFRRGGRWSVVKVGGSVLFGINSALGYFMMLAVMSFNGGVFIAIVFGLAVGYLLFRNGDEDAVDVDVVENPCACA